jgi:hypothetical protein
MDSNMAAKGGIGMGTVIFIVLIVVALATGGPLWGTSWGWFIFHTALIWFCISVVLPLIIVGILFVVAFLIALISDN